MQPRSLFNIVLKIMGIYFIKEVIELSPQLLSSLLYFRESDNDIAIWTILIILVMMLIYGIVIVYLVLKTDWVIDKLELDKNFPETNLNINLHRSTVLYIIIVITGLLILIRVIPYLFRGLYAYYEMRRLNVEDISNDRSYIIMYLAQIVLGICMIIYAKFITNFIEFKRKSRSADR